MIHILFSLISLTSTEIILNWVPEPEFGGFYTALYDGLYEKEGFKVKLTPGGAGAPTIQMVSAGKVQFAITSGDQIIIAHEKGAKPIAVFSVYQRSPLMIMAHESRGLKSLAEVFQSGRVGLEKGHAYAQFLEKKFGFDKVKVVPFSGGVAEFIRDPMYAQQGFIFSEPILARRQGAKPKIFILADEGYNSYMVNLTVNAEYLEKNRDAVQRMVRAVREGWVRYLKDPKPTNERMAKLNPSMDLETFNEGAKLQAALIENDFTKKNGIGAMTEDVWKQHAATLKEFGIVKKTAEPKAFFQNF